MASQQLQIRGGTHIFISLFRHQNICCGYSLESPQCSWRNKKNTSTFWLKKKMPYLQLWLRVIIYDDFLEEGECYGLALLL